ncbi:MAG: GTPase HflX [Bacteroidetes bacterium]|nr:GTPase HflX [Rhodothermia bacterium]MCX7906304.1 GTPase HflX [Bacteroidota bacterium]MDW8285666.1 GTPase HflX [Bacteroidota bacterium]
MRQTWHTAPHQAAGLEPSRPTRERALLVGIVTPQVPRQKAQEYLDELALLADTAGAEVVGRLWQERRTIDPAFFIGRGKVAQLRQWVLESGAHLVIFDEDLSPVQSRNLEREIGVKVIDRTGLILDIFASRARTAEAKLQVELAQLEYLLPRLTGQWTHLERQAGGIGTRGPGETQLETDRRLVKRRIATLRRKLAEIEQQRRTQRKGRSEEIRISLVGYTNAGKSTLMNLLSGARVLTEDRLFATLDTTVRQVYLAPNRRILLSDTVGFIRKLPAHLVASFKSTLDEVREADMLLHVADASHPQLEEQIRVVEKTLQEIGAAGKPVVLVLNKIDRIEDRSRVLALRREFPDAVLLSALRGIGLMELRGRLLGLVESGYEEREVRIPASEARTLAYLHRTAEILEQNVEGPDWIRLRLRVDPKRADALERALRSWNGREPISVDFLQA